MNPMTRVSTLVVGVAGNALDGFSTALSTESGVHVCAKATNEQDALKELEKRQAELVVILGASPALHPPTFMKKVNRIKRIPGILVCRDNVLIIESIREGVVDFVLNFDSNTNEGIKKLSSQVGFKIRTAGRARAQQAAAQEQKVLVNEGSFSTSFQGFVALGASMGGTEATYQVMRRLPSDLPGMVVVQHMPAGFTSVYAKRLDDSCTLKVQEAYDGGIIMKGNVYIAPGGDMHLTVSKSGSSYVMHLNHGEKVSGHRPSVDALFHSVAKCAGSQAVGIILTGMGSDGAQGLLAMRKAGAYTIGQDESSSVVYGMPAAAYNLGAVQKQVSLENVASTLLQVLSKR